MVTWAKIGTINGGSGTDTISFAASAALGGNVTGIQSFSAGIASVIYEAGDVISLVSTAASGNALNNGTINVISAAGFSAAKNDKGSSPSLSMELILTLLSEPVQQLHCSSECNEKHWLPQPLQQVKTSLLRTLVFCSLLVALLLPV